MKLLNIEKQTNNKYLNMYKLTLRNKNENIKEYFVASRREEKDLACLNKNEVKADGVMIIPITKEGELVLLKQYRPAIDDFLYELPAGIIDPGEDMIEAGKRELFEETGLTCVSYEVLVKPSYTSVGMSDETTGIIKMIVEGEIDTSNIEENEEIEVIKVKLEDAKEFARENNVSIKGALVMSLL
ncbi:MAG: NUDIX hydrolase [Clostridium sp.]